MTRQVLEGKCPRCHVGVLVYDTESLNIDCNTCEETWVPGEVLHQARGVRIGGGGA